MWYELTDLLIESALVAQFILMFVFSSVGQNKHGRIVIVPMAIYGENSYLGHIFQDVPTHNQRKQDNSAKISNSRFSNRDGDKEAKLRDCSFKYQLK